MEIKKPEIGGFVETIYGVNGILTAIKPTYYGDMAFIATADMRTFHCPVGCLSLVVSRYLVEIGKSCG